MWCIIQNLPACFCSLEVSVLNHFYNYFLEIDLFILYLVENHNYPWFLIIWTVFELYKVILVSSITFDLCYQLCKTLRLLMSHVTSFASCFSTNKELQKLFPKRFHWYTLVKTICDLCICCCSLLTSRWFILCIFTVQW